MKINKKKATHSEEHASMKISNTEIIIIIIIIIKKAFRNKSHTSHGHRPGLKINKSKGKY